MTPRLIAAAMTLSITARAELTITRHVIPAFNLIPNCSIQQKPLLIYHRAFKSFKTISDVEQHLTKQGAVVPQWRYTMYSKDHFHSTTHEVLIVVEGSARLCFGHQDNPDRVIETVSKGDAIIVPAGVSHRLLDDIEGGFLMVGSYPPGKQWDMCYGDDKNAVARIAELPWFSFDPIYGADEQMPS